MAYPFFERFDFILDGVYARETPATNEWVSIPMESVVQVLRILSNALIFPIFKPQFDFT